MHSNVEYYLCFAYIETILDIGSYSSSITFLRILCSIPRIWETFQKNAITSTQRYGEFV